MQHLGADESSKDNVVEAIEAGVSDYILKPFNLNLLAGKVSKLLEG
jgi:DNA-binding response OmpR family regulator